MIETIILEEPSARKRFLTEPCMREREEFLLHLLHRGMSHERLRHISGYLLRIVHLMHLTVFRTVGLEEIDKAGRAWAAYPGPDRRGKPGTLPGGLPFVAKNWFRFHGRLAVPAVQVHPHDREIGHFTEFLR